MNKNNCHQYYTNNKKKMDTECNYASNISKKANLEDNKLLIIICVCVCTWFDQKLMQYWFY